MFVGVNILGMVRIGIIGSDYYSIQFANLVKGTVDVEFIGFYDEKPDTRIQPEWGSQPIFKSFESLLNCVDAVIINCKSADFVSKATLSLKRYKHVFLLEAKCLRYSEYCQLLKIAEESNTVLYPEFGILIPEHIDDLINVNEPVHFIDIKQTFSMAEGICFNGRFSKALLQSVDFAGNLIKANAKKINAQGWGFTEPGTGMIHAIIDFDNGSSVNILLSNSLNEPQVNLVLHGPSQTTRIDLINNRLKLCKEYLTTGQRSVVEKIYDVQDVLKSELLMFLSAIQHNFPGLNVVETRIKSLRTAHLMQEKINHPTFLNIFYS